MILDITIIIRITNHKCNSSENEFFMECFYFKVLFSKLGNWVKTL